MRKEVEYTETDIPWLPKYPKEWKLKKFKYLYKSSMGATILKENLIENGQIPVYSATESDEIFGYVNETNVELNEGDIVIPARGNSIGHIMVVREQLATCTQTTIYAKPISDEMNTEFAKYYLKGLREHLFQFDRTAIPQITVSQIKENPILVPSEIEQKTIAVYLDQKTAEIDNLISKKQKLIDCLKEEKTALINQAVIKGLYSEKETKFSGDKWLGNVPASWEIKKIKYVSKVQGRVGFKGYSKQDIVTASEGALTIGAKHIQENKITLADPEYISWEKYYESPEIFVEKGQLLVVQRGSLGKVAIVEDELGAATINPSMVILKNLEINPKYLFYLLSSAYFTTFIELINASTAVPMISQEQLENLVIPKPSDEEMEEIVKFIEEKTNIIHKTVFHIKQEIELIKEYRTSLINEVVTGKITLN